MSDPDFYHRQGGDGRYFHGENYEGVGTAVNAAVFGTVGAVAGKKFYDRHRNHADTPELLGASVNQGVYMAFRWKVWVATALMTVLSVPMWAIIGSGFFDLLYGNPDYTWEGQSRLMTEGFTKMFLGGSLGTAWALLALQMVLGLFAVGVTYNRNVRESLFQERWFFRAMRPIERITPNVHWALLHCLTVLPLTVMISIYNH